MIGGKIHPIEYRYGSEELRKLLSVENFYRVMAYVEYIIVSVQEESGLVPSGVSKALKEAINSFSVEEVFEEEKRVKHDVMALINVLARKIGDLGEYLHIGLTSADLRDTAKVLIIRDALKIIKERLDRLICILGELSYRFIDTPCVARTHGVHANVYLLGRKFAVFAEEFLRHRERLLELEKRLYVGKASGAVGIHTALGKIGEKIEEKAMEVLNLDVDYSATQVLGRDRFSELFFVLALISTSLDKLATELRNLQRTEIDEVSEFFGSEQVGSTAMPHKRNPINLENISSLSRILRSLVFASLENIVLWHERDLTNSASERILIPETLLLLDEQLSRMIRVLRKLDINKDKIKNNLWMTNGAIFSEIITTKLALAGYGRQRAHKHIRRISMRAWKEKKSFVELIMEDPEVKRYIGDTKDLFEPEKYLEVAKRRTMDTIRKIESTLKIKIVD